MLPPNAWAVRKVRAYVPAHYAVCIETAPRTDASHLLSLLPAPAADLLRDSSRTRTEHDLVGGVDQDQNPENGDEALGVQGHAVTDCYKVSTKAARDVADALSGLEHEPGYGDYGVAYRVAEAEPVTNGWPTWLRIEAYLPDGQVPFLGGYG